MENLGRIGSDANSIIEGLPYPETSFAIDAIKAYQDFIAANESPATAPLLVIAQEATEKLSQACGAMDGAREIVRGYLTLIGIEPSSSETSAPAINQTAMAETPLNAGFKQTSAENFQSLEEAFLNNAVAGGLFPNREEAMAALEEEYKKILAQNGATINMTPNSMMGLLSNGNVETYWDYADKDPDSVADRKSHHPDYAQTRKVADDGLRRHAPQDVRGNNPVYAAVAGPNDLRRGAASDYGEWWVVLNPEVSQRSVCHFSDSYRQTERVGAFDDTKVLTYQDALRAKAMAGIVGRHNMSQGRAFSSGMIMIEPGQKVNIIDIDGTLPGYVEATIFDKLTIGSIKEMGVSLANPESLHNSAAVLRGLDETTRAKVRITLADDTEPLTASWLRRRYNTTTFQTEEQPSDKLWERLGLSPDATYDQVRDRLNEEAGKAWIKVRRVLYAGIGHKPSLPNFRDSGSWHNHFVDLRQAKPNTTEANRQQIDDFVELQRARAFFH